ncbi:hypothetical protein MPER_00324 [Moniliophthora perniciosa FA553]|nr:hypothetical protein MPER_00324 [Moniliophthora perniciosa FA553]
MSVLADNKLWIMITAQNRQDETMRPFFEKINRVKWVKSAEPKRLVLWSSWLK